MNRSNSFVSSFKWWPLQGHNSNSNNNNNNSNNSNNNNTVIPATSRSNVNIAGISQSAPSSPTSNWPSSAFHFQNKSIAGTSTNSISGIGGGGGGGGATFGSSVAVQKLRESKWFRHEEQRIFCAVIESGFIVEVRSSAAAEAAVAAAAAADAAGINDIDTLDTTTIITTTTNPSISIIPPTSCSSNTTNSTTASTRSRRISSSSSTNTSSFLMETQDENETPVVATWFGIVLCKLNKDNKPKPDTIEIYFVKIRENGTYKLIKLSLADVWNNGWELRINNFADKEKMPHNEKDIRNQISLARKAKQSLWNNNKHFVYWCRYGSRQQDVRKRQMSECVKWGSVGMNAGMLLVHNNRYRHNSHSK